MKKKNSSYNLCDSRCSSSRYDGWASIRHIQTSTSEPIKNINDDRNGSKNDKDDAVVTTPQTTNATMTHFDMTSANDHSSVNLVSLPNNPALPAPQQQAEQPFIVVVQHWLQQLRAIPNMITVSRILLIPFISYWIIQQQITLAFIGCVYAAISDVLDGYIARRYPYMQTSLGTYLDPLGTVCCLCFGFAVKCWSLWCYKVTTLKRHPL